MNRGNRRLRIFWGVNLLLFCLTAKATDLGRVDNWDVDGAHGIISVQGALTVSACRLAMDSSYQSVDLGTQGQGTKMLQRIGREGNPTAVHIWLEDCLIGQTRNQDLLGNILWSPDMPAVKIRFLAPSYSDLEPNLVRVNGVKGIGLLLSDEQHKPIMLGEYQKPKMLSPGHNKLTYYITPIRTLDGLEAGKYNALIKFQLSYE